MNFETMIREAQKKGLTTEEIAKQFSETLNSMEDRDSLLNKMTDEFVASDKCEPIDAAKLYTVIMSDKHPEWGVDEIKEFFKTIQETADIAAELIDNPIETIYDRSKNILNEFLKLF